MNSFNFVSPLVNALVESAKPFFARQTKPSQQNLLHLLLAILATGSTSVRRCFLHFIQPMGGKSLNCFYRLLKGSTKPKEDGDSEKSQDKEKAISLSFWSEQILRLALSCIPVEYLDKPILFIVDDTLIGKAGKFFAFVKLLFDHSGYRISSSKGGTRGISKESESSEKSKDSGGSGNYVNGNNVVTLLVLVPVKILGIGFYLPVIAGHKLWSGDPSREDSMDKLHIAAALTRPAAEIVGKDRPIQFLCDSWFPRGAVAELLDIPNLSINANVKISTVMYEPEPETRKGRRGRRPKHNHGKRIYPSDIELVEIPGTDYRIGSKMVKLEIFGDRLVQITVTQLGKNGALRLYACTNPSVCETFAEDLALLNLGKKNQEDAQNIIKIDKKFAPLIVYFMRWKIETVYQQLKASWHFCDYAVRSENAINNLLNLQGIAFSLLSLLPARCPAYAYMVDKSIQERRHEVAMELMRELFLKDLRGSTVNGENSPAYQEACQLLTSPKPSAA